MSEWTLAYDGYVPAQEGLREALCTLGNGVFATRGAAPESAADGVHYPGTYLAGCYSRAVTEVAGVAVENEDLVNLPNWLPLTFRPEGGHWFGLDLVELLDYRQELDLRRGVLTRRLRFQEHGRITSVIQRRLVSMHDPHVAALETTFLPENWSGRLEVRSALDGRVTNAGVARYQNLRGDHVRPLEATEIDHETLVLEAQTMSSGIRMALAARTRVRDEEAVIGGPQRTVEDPGFVAHDLLLELVEGQASTIEKVVVYCSSLDHASYTPGVDARARIRCLPGFAELLEAHVLAWDHLWRRFDLRVDGDDRAQMILRLHSFHLLQTVSEHTVDRDASVPARGLHGEAYRGHIFWDELFIFPFLNLRLPTLTRSLLLYRYRRLPAARRAAAAAGYAGAMFPWQSGSDGREESQSVHLNPRSSRWLPDHSRRQRHINLAIAHNVWHYYQVTEDWEFLRSYGAEVLVEITRFWTSIATWNPARTRYEIHGVMGPDEYHDGFPGREEPGLSNNAYTNVMVAWVLCRALDLLDILPEHHRTEIVERLHVTREEMERWEDISRRLYVPFHGDGLISQFEGYEELKELDWEGYRKHFGDIHRLDRILESEGDSPNHYKLSKQADVLMLFYLLPSGELADLLARLGYRFDPEHDVRRHIDYYLARTSHGSTLSRVVHAWVLSRVDPVRSYDLFFEALESDVSDIQGGTTSEGIHLGAMAGTLDLLQRSYGGVETRGEVLWIDPALPEPIRSLSFEVHYRGHQLQVEISKSRVRVASRTGPWAPIKLSLCGDVRELAAGEIREVSVAG